MSVSEVLLGSKTERAWRAAWLADLPEVAAEAPYREERARLRFQAAVFKDWTAWQLKELPAATAAFHAALDQPVRDAELSRWLLTHLLERRDDYFQQPINGAWLPRSLRPEPNQTGVLVEHALPERTLASAYDEPTVAALNLLHRLLLAEPGELRRAASVYFAYHPLVEPGTQMVLAPIAAGTFLMGSPEGEADRYSYEGPRHQVTLSHDFWMGIYPVTQPQYKAVMGIDPSGFQGENRPVVNVSWDDAAGFCEKLTDQAGTAGLLPDGYVFRLPTEAEWEYCCRAGTETAMAFGDSLSSAQANFNGNYPYGGAKKGPHLQRTSDVGSYPANAWGLHDFHGNVREWCLDAAEWDKAVKTDTYVDGAVDPVYQLGRFCVYRGGSWDDIGRWCRSAYRYSNVPGNRGGYLGFRVCLALSPAKGQSGTVTETGETVPPERSRAGTSSRSKSRQARKNES